ncbi:preprotein translocase subunit SecE [Rhodococcus rhodnii]|uniref:Protein translocase subunit SecE n=2 Tax=Rhodococcus rhodnii TaxID=38312 RepID=R7WMH8_9NOCA|nr:preprotein translocase subunit SecE [Rhodococcus rhodnii]EOM76512.1 preprotein translocase subunit [Rhodococcus rhodnii LMG 5362]TXG91931.1 preprotein translocase subunit SecE [Rhodococcus rhodnii]
MSEDRAKRDGDATDEGGASDATSSGRSSNDTGAVPSGKRRGRSARSSESDRNPVRGTVDSASTSRGGVRTADGKAGRGNIFKRLRRFIREVIAELRKVIWPNRKQMITYTTVVLVFMAFMVTFIGLLDTAVVQGVDWLFG